MKLILCLLVTLSACSFKNKQLVNQKLKGHEELYSEPNEPKLIGLEKTEKRIVIAATNDLHGNYNPPVIAFSDDANKEQSIQIGGSEIFTQYFNILRETYKDVVLVDSGDIFSSADKLAEVRHFYQKNKYDAVTVGLRDFNLKIPTSMGNNTKMFQEFTKESKVPLLLSNLYELKTARAVEWEGVKSHLIKDVNGVKVGLIGLIPDDIVAQTPVNNRVGLFVENMLQATLRHARLMRSLGADIVVVMTHQSITCGANQAEEMKLPIAKVNFEPLNDSACNLKNELGVYLERLPPHLVDLVIGGRNEHKIANYVNENLVLAGHPEGRSFSFVEFVVDTKTKKVVKEKTKVHQPVMFCHEFFKETRDCYFEDSSVDHKKRIPATFLGKEIVPSVTMTKAESKKTIDLTQKMISLNADLTYVPQNSGETQLLILKMSGIDLIKVLEKDYNRGKRTEWQPSPFNVTENILKLTVGGKAIETEKTYRVLTDLESIQKHHVLVSHVQKTDSETHMNLSWKHTNDRMPSSHRTELTDL